MAGSFGGLHLEAPEATNAATSVGGHRGGGKELRPIRQELRGAAGRVRSAVEATRAHRKGVHVADGPGSKASKETDKKEHKGVPLDADGVIVYTLVACYPPRPSG